ncbi:MAG: hypothetical protein LKM36_05765 [Flavobacteriales bacterium]|jgi:hypothetical protein|nr:hypothetical protein [Flavobacteriales bacterium]
MEQSEVYGTINGLDMDGMQSATLELRPDGQYYFTMELLGQTVKGTYLRDGKNLLLRPNNGMASLGTLNGDTLAVNGLQLLKRKN